MLFVGIKNAPDFGRGFAPEAKPGSPEAWTPLGELTPFSHSSLGGELAALPPVQEPHPRLGPSGFEFGPSDLAAPCLLTFD